VLFPYQETSHPTFNPLYTLLLLLEQFSEAQVSNFLCSPVTKEWRPKEVTTYMDFKSIQTKLEYQKLYREPSKEIFPLVLASYSSHIILGGFPIDLLQHIFSYLDPRLEDCTGCHTKIIRASQLPTLNCGCAYKKCIACDSLTYNIQSIYGMAELAFDYCTCRKCLYPRIVTCYNYGQRRQYTQGYLTRFYLIVGELHCDCKFKCVQCKYKTRIKYLVLKESPQKGSFLAKRAWCGCIQMTTELTYHKPSDDSGYMGEEGLGAANYVHFPSL
jgi:hypothetical protein